MFTGIVEELGRLRRRDGGRFEFEADRVLEDLQVGASLAHNGCCLTVVEVADGVEGAAAGRPPRPGAGVGQGHGVGVKPTRVTVGALEHPAVGLEQHASHLRMR